MTMPQKWINCTAAAMLSTAVSVTAFAAAPDAPDFIMHEKASVKLNVSNQGIGEIVNDKLKTEQVINLIMGRPLGSDIPKNEELGVVTACAADVDQVAFVVYDKDSNNVLSDPENAILLDIEGAVVETKDALPVEADLLLGAEEGDGFIVATGTLTFKEIGDKVADGTWDETSTCGEKFKAKTVTGTGYLADVVMKGKVQAGKPVRAADFPDDVFPGPRVAITKLATDLNGAPIDEPNDVVTTAGDEIDYVVFVENVGGLDLTNVVVTDTKTDEDLICDSTGTNTIGLLAPGAGDTCRGTNTVAQEEIDTACALDDDGNPVGPGAIINLASVTSNETNPVITGEALDVDCDYDAPTNAMGIVKTFDNVICASCGGDKDAVEGVGDIIEYTIVVSNRNAVDAISGVTVNDTIATVDCGDFDGILQPDDAAVGGDDEVTCTAEYEVTADAIAGACGSEQSGNIRNIAVTTSDQTGNFAADALTPVDCELALTPAP